MSTNTKSSKDTIGIIQALEEEIYAERMATALVLGEEYEEYELGHADIEWLCAKLGRPTENGLTPDEAASIGITNKRYIQDDDDIGSET